jgi:hypothetical protein
MRSISRAFAALAIFAAVTYPVTTVAAALTRLPTFIQSNAYVAGQVYGCTVRLIRYLELTINRGSETGHTPPVMDVNLIVGLQIADLKDDARQALVASSGGAFPMDESETAITEIADLEYDGSAAGAPGYSEAWMQAMGCSALFRQFGLYDIYQ